MPIPRITPAGVFDAWSWCASDVLEWRDLGTPLATNDALTTDNPADLVFVCRSDEASAFLPRELACMHARGYDLTSEWSLAPWAIDDATDLFFERRVPPGDVLWLAAPSLRALVWGLHDWAHFHNHGPFDEPAHTELACDLVALAWLRDNEAEIGLSTDQVEAVARGLAQFSRGRFEAEAKAPPVDDLESLFLGPYPA
ncbi:MAG: hypothetical protein JST00_30295 [Deltaproteobacteria bacterium]|nr:hypothetical protein [Deltaproteobacteria bacterium]